MALTVDDDEVVGLYPFHLQEDTLYLRWEDVDAANLEHVVCSACYLGHAH